MRARAAAAVVTVALAAAGCGADDEVAPVTTENDDSPALVSPTASPIATPTPTPSATPPTATAPSAPAPPPDAGVPEGHSGEDQEGGAGDEEAARTPVDLVLDEDGLTPARVEVAPFLGVEVRVRNRLATEASLQVQGEPSASRVPPGVTYGFELDGLRTGQSYTLVAEGQTARIVAAVQPGP